MYTISKDFEFSAAHQLRGLPPEHPCGRMHGHNYTVRIELSTYTLNEVGFVLDYGKLGALKTIIDNTFDHKVLNDGMTPNPTAENLAAYIADIAFTWLVTDRGEEGDRRDFTLRVGVSETPKTWAWCAYPEVA